MPTGAPATRKSCTLGDPESLEARTPPRWCTLWILDANEGCTVWVPGCVPGLRELDIVGGTIGGDQIADGSVGMDELAPDFTGDGSNTGGAYLRTARQEDAPPRTTASKAPPSRASRTTAWPRSR